MRVAFDVHGVLDTHEEYRQLMRSLYHLNHTVYIISGQALDEEMQAFLAEHDLNECHHHYYGIETHLLENGFTSYETRVEGKYWADEIWNPVKAEICAAEGIDIIFDDSPIYAESFADIDTQFSLVVNKRLFRSEMVGSPKRRF